MAVSVAEVQAWLSVATGVATLLAFVLAIYQLRLVRRQMELQTNLGIMQAERTLWSISLANPEVCPNLLAERWGKPASERLFAALLLDHYEALFFQYRRGAIPKSNWQPIERAMLEHIASPTIRAVWDGHKDLYWAPFSDRIEAALAVRDREKPAGEA